MKIIRHWIILLLVEFLALTTISLLAPSKTPSNPKVEESNINTSSSYGEYSVSIEEYGERGIKIIASESQKESVEATYQMKLAGVKSNIHWMNPSYVVITIQDQNDTISSYQVLFYEDKPAEILEGNTQPTIEEPQQKEPETKPEVTPSSPSDISIPEVTSVKVITSDADIEDSYANAPAKPQSSQTNDEQINHASDDKQYDLKIESGIVSITLDHGMTWKQVPIKASRMQDFWLTYYRMGNQSYYIDDSMIMIAFAQKYMQPHIIVSMDQGTTWKDVQINCGSASIQQISINVSKDGGYIITMMTAHSMIHGTSSNGEDWKFTKPISYQEDFSGMYSMALMSDGTLLIPSFRDVAISKDDGKTFTHLKDLDASLAEKVAYDQTIYEENGMYCIPLQNGSIAKSKDGITWIIA